MSDEKIIKKIRREIRLNKPISKNDVVLVTDDLSEIIFKEVIAGMPIKILKKNFICSKKIFENKELKNFVGKNKITKIIIPWTADDEIDYFVSGFIRKKNNLKYLGHYEKFVKLFLPLFDEEVKILAENKKIKYKLKKHDAFVEKVEKKYAFAKFSLLNSIKQLQKIIK